MDDRPVIIDRYGERWVPVSGGGAEFHLPAGKATIKNEVLDRNWKWPGYPDRPFENNRG